MIMAFYDSLEDKKKRIPVDEYIDGNDFDFLLNFASNVDELWLHRAEHAELCLSVINASIGNFWHNNFGAVSKISEVSGS